MKVILEIEFCFYIEVMTIVCFLFYHYIHTSRKSHVWGGGVWHQHLEKLLKLLLAKENADLYKDKVNEKLLITRSPFFYKFN